VTRRIGFLGENRCQRGHPACAAECPPACDHFVQHHAEREDVGARVGRLAIRLFGRHVRRRTENHPRLGSHQGADPALGGVAIGQVVWIGSGFGEFCETEIENFDAVLVGDHDVARLEIPVQDAGGMRGRHRIGDLNRVLQALVYRQPLSRNQRGERAAGDVLHRDEIVFALLADLVNRDDMRMVEAGGRSRFLNEALLPFVVDRLLAVEQLERHRAAETGIDSTIDDPHAAFAEWRKDLVMRDRSHDHRTRRRGVTDLG
jgi:hypothetical protein